MLPLLRDAELPSLTVSAFGPDCEDGKEVKLPGPLEVFGVVGADCPGWQTGGAEQGQSGEGKAGGSGLFEGQEIGLGKFGTEG